MNDSMRTLARSKVGKVVNDMFQRQSFAATLGNGARSLSSFASSRKNPWLRNDVLTRPFARLFLIFRFIVFAGFWIILIACRLYLLAWVVCSLFIFYRLLFTDIRATMESWMKLLRLNKRALRKLHREPLREYKDLQGWRRLLFDLSLLISARMLLLVLGIYHIKRYYVTHQELKRLRHKIWLERNIEHASMDEKSCEYLEQKQENISDSSNPLQLANEIDPQPPFFIVSNRVAAIDPIVLANEFGVVSIICKRWIASLPIVGDWARKISCIFTDYDIGCIIRIINERAREYYRILNDVETDHFAPRFAVFPEGTTTNGSQLIEFHKGPFTFGYPVQPVVIRYPYSHFNAAWLETPSTIKYALLVLSQVFQCVEVSKYNSVIYC